MDGGRHKDCMNFTHVSQNGEQIFREDAHKIYIVEKVSSRYNESGRCY